MLFKKFRPFTGPVEYKFKDPNTGYIYKASDKVELLQRIVSYRRQNELEPIDGLDYVVDNYLCGCPENFGSCQDNQLERHLMGYIRGGIALLKNMLYKKYVSQDVAEARAKICVTCPLNVFPDKKGFLKWSDEMAEAAVGDRRTSLHEKLGNCEVCTCVLKSKVFFGEPITLPKDEYDKLPNYCWQKIEGKPK